MELPAPAGTVLPAAPVRARPRVGLAACSAAAVLTVAGSAAWLVQRGHSPAGLAPVASAESVGGPYVVDRKMDSVPRFSVHLPAAPVTADQAVASDGSKLLVGAKIAPGVNLLVVRFGPSVSDPRKVLEDMAAQSDGLYTASGPVERTSLGPVAAYTRRFTLASGTVLQEFRFVRDGVVYGIGVLAETRSAPLDLEQGLASARSFRWKA